jgi:hypothetical protein
MPTGDFDKAPNPKIQAPKKSQAPNLKKTTRRHVALELGTSLGFGAWNLELAAAAPLFHQ